MTEPPDVSDLTWPESRPPARPARGDTFYRYEDDEEGMMEEADDGVSLGARLGAAASLCTAVGFVWLAIYNHADERHFALHTWQGVAALVMFAGPFCLAVGALIGAFVIHGIGLIFGKRFL